jgi:hypothetical protein
MNTTSEDLFAIKLFFVGMFFMHVGILATFGVGPMVIFLGAVLTYMAVAYYAFNHRANKG